VQHESRIERADQRERGQLFVACGSEQTRSAVETEAGRDFTHDGCLGHARQTKKQDRLTRGERGQDHAQLAGTPDDSLRIGCHASIRAA
jgi:hypothetical protein